VRRARVRQRATLIPETRSVPNSSNIVSYLSIYQTRADNGSWVSCVAISWWATWVIGQRVLTRDPSVIKGMHCVITAMQFTQFQNSSYSTSMGSHWRNALPDAICITLHVHASPSPHPSILNLGSSVGKTGVCSQRRHDRTLLIMHTKLNVRSTVWPQHVIANTETSQHMFLRPFKSFW